MVRDAEVTAGDYVALVLRGIATEGDVGVTERLASQARTAATQLGAQHLVWARLQQLSDAWWELAVSSDPGSDRQRVFASAFVDNAVSPPQRDRLRQLLSGATGLDGLAVDTGLRWAVVRRLSALGLMSEAELADELARDDTAEGRLFYLKAQASRPDPDAKARAWQALTTDPQLPHHQTVAIIEGFNFLEHQDLVAPYLPQLYAALPTLWASRAHASATAPLQLRALLPSWDATAEGLARADQALGESLGKSLGESLPSSVQRVLEECRAEQARALRCRALERPDDALGAMHRQPPDTPWNRTDT
jgi:aminopeptidase N